MFMECVVGEWEGARKIFTRLQALDYSLLAQTHEQLRERTVPARMWQVTGTWESTHSKALST